MMHGREKSDLAIVAAKPANNDGRPSAELVERRAGAEGNAGQDRTRRAQDRASVSQGLDRVRHVARQRKKERFTALLHHVTPNRLRTAFFALRRQAAPGVDGLTWQAYEADLDRRIEDLHERVHRGAYRGTFQLQRKSRSDRMRSTLRAVKEALRQRMHQPIPVQGRWLKQVIGGYFAYHAVPTNIRAVRHSATTSRTCGAARSGAGARKTGRRGHGCRAWPTIS